MNSRKGTHRWEKNVKQACLRPGSRHVTSVCHGVLTDGEADVCFSVKYRRGPIEPRLRNFGQVKCAVLGCGWCPVCEESPTSSRNRSCPKSVEEINTKAWNLGYALICHTDLYQLLKTGSFLSAPCNSTPAWHLLVPLQAKHHRSCGMRQGSYNTW